MKISASIMKAMSAAGCSAEQIIAAVEAAEREAAEKAALKREQGRERQRRFRERNAGDALHSVTQRDEALPPIPDKEKSPTPPKEINPTPEPSSLRSEAASDVQVDFRDLLWREGVRSLSRQTGKPDASIRSLIGRWCRDTKDDCRVIYDSIRKAEQDRVGDPIAWVSKAITPQRAPPLTPFQQRTQDLMDACDRVIGANGNDKSPSYDFDLEPADWRAN